MRPLAPKPIWAYFKAPMDSVIDACKAHPKGKRRLYEPILANKRNISPISRLSLIRGDAKAEAKAGQYGERTCARWISCATVLIRGRMISLKKYLDSAPFSTNADCWQQKDEIASVAIAAYGSALESMGNCSLGACPSLGSELKQRLGELNRNLSSRMNCESLEFTDRQVQEQLQDWGRRTATHCQQKSDEVKELLIVMARIAESVGARDQRCAGQINEVTARLTAIASLDNLTEIRSSIMRNAAELKT